MLGARLSAQSPAPGNAACGSVAAFERNSQNAYLQPRGFLFHELGAGFFHALARASRCHGCRLLQVRRCRSLLRGPAQRIRLREMRLAISSGAAERCCAWAAPWMAPCCQARSPRQGCARCSAMQSQVLSIHGLRDQLCRRSLWARAKRRPNAGMARRAARPGNPAHPYFCSRLSLRCA